MKSIFLLIQFLIIIHTTHGQDRVLFLDDSLREVFGKEKNDSIKLHILEELSNVWKNKSFIKSIEYTKEAIAFSDIHFPNHSLGFRYQLAFGYMQIGDAVRSIEIFNQIIQEVGVNNQEAYCTALAFIAMNYENLGNLEKALELQLQASAIYERLLLHDSAHDRRGVLGNPHKLATYYLKLNQLDSALFYGQKALTLLNSEPMNDYNRFFSWYIKTVLGDTYYTLGNYKKAFDYYTDAEREIIQYNSKEDLPPIYLGISKVYFKNKETKKSISFAKRSYQLADTLKLIPLIKESALFLKVLYSDVSQMDSAMIYYEIAIAAKDSMWNADINRKLDALTFEEERKSQELKSLQQEKLFRNKQIYLLIGIFSITALAAFLYYKYRLNQKATQLLEFENREIFVQRNQLQLEVEGLEIKALKAQMNPHFIFNCINSIDAFIYSNDKYQATLYLNKFAKLLRNILDSSKNNTVHLAKDLQTLHLYTDLEELRNENKFVTKYLIEDGLTNSPYVVPPLIIQPLVENAILHGLKNRKMNSGLLTISVSIQHNQLKYEIVDNGIGRSAASEIIHHKEGSIGVELTQSRIKMFNHESTPSMEIIDLYDDRLVAQGTRVIVRLNLQTV